MKWKESSHLELKEVVNAGFKKEIVAFANTDGGEIIIGVADDGTVVGVPEHERVMEQVTSMIHHAIRPDMLPFSSVEAFTDAGKVLVRVSVSRGSRRPYHLSDKGLRPSGVYVRHGVASVPASEEMIRAMIQESDGTAYDSMRSINQDLTFHYAEPFFEQMGLSLTYEKRRTLKLVDVDGYFTNAALLLSDQCPHQLRCAVFQGNSKAHFQDRKIFSGSVLKQLDEGLAYISMSNHLSSRIDGLRRKDHYDYYPDAIREALVNMIVHRDYSYSGGSIVNIFDNRIEFVSIGGLVKGLTLPDILHGVSQSRNTVLADVFYRLALIESWGSGIQKMFEGYTDTLKPEFLIEASSFVTVLPKRPAPWAVEQDVSSPCYPVTELNQEVSRLVDSHRPNKDNRMRVLMDFIQERKVVSRKDVEELLGCSGFLARQLLNQLLEAGRITVSGSARSTRYHFVGD